MDKPYIGDGKTMSSVLLVIWGALGLTNTLGCHVPTTNSRKTDAQIGQLLKADHPEHLMLKITNCWPFLELKVGIIEHNPITAGQS